jgi:hypothetical protein
MQYPSLKVKSIWLVTKAAHLPLSDTVSWYETSDGNVIIIYYYLFKLQMGFYPVAVYYNRTQHTNNTHHTK